MGGYYYGFKAAITFMESKVAMFRLSIPIHGNQTMKLGLRKHMMKLANLSEDDL